MPDSNTITLTREEYQDLIDARDHAIAMRDVAFGRIETIAAADMPAFLAAPTPLAFWRKKRGKTESVLAAAAGITQAYFAQLEAGLRRGDLKHYVALARALDLRVEDLAIADQVQGKKKPRAAEAGQG